MDAVLAGGLLDTEGQVIHPPPIVDVAGYESIGAAVAGARPGAAPDRSLRRDRGRRGRPLPRREPRVRRARAGSSSAALPTCRSRELLAAADAELGPFTSMRKRAGRDAPRASCSSEGTGTARMTAYHLGIHTPTPRRQRMELGMISSTWFDTKIGTEEGIRKAKEIGFDTYDIFEDPLDIDDATRKLIKDTCEEVGLRDPLRRLRRLRDRRLQPVGAPLHARPHQGVRRPGRVSRRPQRAARRRRVLLGRRGVPAPGDLGHGEATGGRKPASTRSRRASRSRSSSSRSTRRC